MKLLYQGMKKFKFFLGSEKIPFGYEKKPVFENFPFHTLGYENFGCFFLMKSMFPTVRKKEVLFIGTQFSNLCTAVDTSAIIKYSMIDTQKYVSVYVFKKEYVLYFLILFTPISPNLHITWV
jgi:hypothetical protein